MSILFKAVGYFIIGTLLSPILMDHRPSVEDHNPSLFLVRLRNRNVQYSFNGRNWYTVNTIHPPLKAGGKYRWDSLVTDSTVGLESYEKIWAFEKEHGYSFYFRNEAIRKQL